MEDSTLELCIGIAIRLGIISAHVFEGLGLGHAVVIIGVLWSVEELVDIKKSTRTLKNRHGQVINPFRRLHKAQ